MHKKDILILLISFFVAVILSELMLQIIYNSNHNKWLFNQSNIKTKNRPFDLMFKKNKNPFFGVMRGVFQNSSGFSVSYLKRINDRRKYNLREGYKSK